MVTVKKTSTALFATNARCDAFNCFWFASLGSADRDREARAHTEATGHDTRVDYGKTVYYEAKRGRNG